jgi:HTH domain in Mos1 transposase
MTIISVYNNNRYLQSVIDRTRSKLVVLYKIAISRIACIKFCFKIGKNATETFELIKLAFEDVSLSRCVTIDWFKCFKEGRISIEDDHRPGRPFAPKTNDTITLVRNKIRND